ncbi:MAG TPA: MBL fold metallo-hydrolase [Dissulfurispiraceae bacterium]|nr:MBL fold metallo-hydrolase [Dissulfurispiraceae bacterium]
MLDKIHWLGHDTFVIAGSKRIYTDPFKIKKKDTADIILVTHEHYDHCSPDDIEQLRGSGTVIIAPPDCAAKIKGSIMPIQPGQTLSLQGVVIKAVPAYNTNKQFHVRDRRWVGYVVTIDGKTLYLAGDTDFIPEMKTLSGIDVALLPVSGTYVMTAEEAALAALAIKPAIAIPMHYGAIVGSRDDALKFATLLKGKIDVAILNQE